jgi:hypothetical protein
MNYGEQAALFRPSPLEHNMDDGLIDMMGSLFRQCHWILPIDSTPKKPEVIDNRGNRNKCHRPVPNSGPSSHIYSLLRRLGLPRQ